MHGRTYLKNLMIKLIFLVILEIGLAFANDTYCKSHETDLLIYT